MTGAAGPARAADERQRAYWLPLAAGGVLLGGAVAVYMGVSYWSGLGPGVSAGAPGSVAYFNGASTIRYFPPPTHWFAVGLQLYALSFYYVGWYWAVALAARFLGAVVWSRRPASLVSGHPGAAGW